MEIKRGGAITDINGGTIDGAVIGGTTPAAGTFTTLNATGGGALTGTWSNIGTVSAATSITSSAFVGPLTGNVTGNASGTALTVTQAAQTAITSVGTLTSLAVGGITATGVLSVDNTTQTSSGTTGSIHTDGGLGVAKDLYCGGNISLAATNGVYFDGGAHTLIKENSANVLRCVAGGSGGVDLTNGATSWTSVSDERAKNLGEPIIDAMAKLGTLRTVYGTFRDDHQEIRHPFLIAQDVLAVYPEAVALPEEEDLYRLSYTDMIPLMISGMNETNATLLTYIETLEARLEAAGI